VVIEQWPDDPVAWAIAANSLRCMARLEDSADLLLSAPPNIIFLPKVRELADFLKGFGHHLPLFESQDWLRPLTEEIAAGEPDMFCAVGVLAVESLQPAKYYLGSFPSLAAAIHNCRQVLRQILQGIHTEGMDQNELLAWAERFSLSALTIPSSTFCPRADIREESAKMAAAPSNQANQTKP
jgi:hypothetical protein